MALLQVFQNGKKLKELLLTDSQEWVIGRASSSDLILDGEQGISRQHFKVYFENGVWQLQVLSRYGELYFHGKKTLSLTLKDGMRFEVPPFEFLFTDAHSEAAEDKTPALNAFQPAADAGSPAHDFSDRTMVGVLTVHPYLKVMNQDGEVTQMFRLEGHAWVAGRDTSCALFIDNPQFSRRHFEIRFEEGAYFVKDLGSSNGTLLNGEALSTVNWTPLRSGDVLTVVDWNLHFELRDSSFEEKLQEISQDLLAPVPYSPEIQPQSFPQVEHKAQKPKLKRHMAFFRHKDNPEKVNWVRVSILLILVFVAAEVIFPTDDKKEAPQAKAGGPAPFEKLTPQQQQYVKETYRLADRLFKEGRYEMARQEVAKIHQLIPSYEESKNLEKLAEVAIQTQLEQQKAEAEERMRAEMEEKIQATVAQCTGLLKPHVEMKAVDDCLTPAIHLNPEHPAILKLKAEVDQMIAERIEKEAQRAEMKAHIRRQKSLLGKAKNLNEAGKPLEAIKTLEQVAQSAGAQNYRVEAKREIASIQKNLVSQQAELQLQADDAVKKGDLKTAISVLKKAIDINPDNETLKGRVNSLVTELKKQMQALYQEGVLEESVGEIDSAKAKWKKILETSVPEEDYYKKARSKLKKYEAM